MIAVDMPNQAYHDETEHLSSSVLKAALPEHYKAGGSQEALDFGTLVHSVVLEPDSLDQYAVLDAAAIGLKSDGTPAANPMMTVAWKRAVAEAAVDGKTVVAQSDWDKAHLMAESIRNHDEARALLYDGEGQAELSAFATNPEGHRFKARFDRLIPGAVVDLKTTSAKPGADSLTRSVVDYGYDLSAAHYLDVAALCDLDATKFLWVFVGKEAPYRVVVAEAHPDYIARGLALRDLALARITDPDAEPYEGATGRLTLTPPPWARIAAPTAIPADFTWSVYDHA